MCGICGYIDSKPISNEILRAMNDMMYHRGPDDCGIWQKQGKKCIGFAQRRLSIMDLSELGHQPMLSNDGNLVIVFNGEIYNFKELKRELSNEGYQFMSECDTEVILAAWQKWGEEAIRRLDGMFAFALYDQEREEIFFARDRIGKKPLYYFWDGHIFVFGSELKAIMKHPGFKKELNTNILEKYLCYQYINSPDTIFKNTYKLPSGHYMSFSQKGLEIIKYWDIYECYREGKTNIISDYVSCKSFLKKSIYQAVDRRLVADVPVGAFLSGGIDSTLVTAMANDIVGGIKTFTIGFDDKERNEADFAAQTAKYLHTDHEELYVSERDMLDMIDDLCIYYDEPFADPSQIPTMLVSKLAKQKVTVALTGDGGDEFFCGYSMYDYVIKAQKIDSLTAFSNALLNNNKTGFYLKQKLPMQARALLDNRSASFKVQLFVDLPEQIVSQMLVKPDSNVKYELERQLDTENWQEKRMLLDMYTYLPEDVLAKADRASMKYSLELRCPLLDTKVMEDSFRIPHLYKYNRGDKKYILKEILYDYIPKNMMNRPKNGFGVPLGQWLRSYLKKDVLRVSDPDFLVRQGIFKQEAVQEIIKKVEQSDQKPYPKILWAYYIFQLWYMKYMDEI